MGKSVEQLERELTQALAEAAKAKVQASSMEMN